MYRLVIFVVRCVAFLDLVYLPGKVQGLYAHHWMVANVPSIGGRLLFMCILLCIGIFDLGSIGRVPLGLQGK